MVVSIKNIGDKLFKGYLCFMGAWIVFALTFQGFFVYLHFTGQDKRVEQISNEISWKIDGTFKNNPDNIWYEEPKTK
jgi:hypothetical protein